MDQNVPRGCSAEDAAYDIALTAEAAEGDGSFTITVMSDLEKGFENVRHDRWGPGNFLSASKEYTFPTCSCVFLMSAFFVLFFGVPSSYVCQSSLVH